MQSKIKLHFNGGKYDSRVFFGGGGVERGRYKGEGNDLLLSVILGLKLVSEIHLLLLCTLKPLFSFPFGDFSPFFI